MRIRVTVLLVCFLGLLVLCLKIDFYILIYKRKIIYYMPQQVKVGWRSGAAAAPSVPSVWNLLTAAYNADATGSSSLKTSLVASYNGESNVNDSFGANNGTAVGGLTYTTGKIGNAFDFNGTNAYVGIPNTSGQLDFTGDFSISTWVMPLVTSASFNVYFGNHKSGGAYGSGYVFYLDRNVNKLKLTIGTQNSYSEYFYNWIPLVNTWYHLTVTRKKSTGTKFYINGVEVIGYYTGMGGTATLDPTYQTGQIYNIGSVLNGSSLGNYRQDALNIWNKELTASEVSELYNSGNGAQYIGDNFYKPTPNDALNTYNGTAQGGLTYEVGKVGTAFKFNGTNAYVELGDVMDLGLSSWSYGMWFKSAVASSGTLFSKSIAAGLAGRFAAYIDSNRINFIFDYNSPLNSAGNTVNIGTSNTIVTNTWYHLVCVFDRTSNIRLYLNGVLQSVTTSYGVNDLSQYGAANTNYNTSCPFRIGAYTAADNINVVSFFNGSIDTFNVWNRVLTASEITELYNSGNGKQYPY